MRASEPFENPSTASAPPAVSAPARSGLVRRVTWIRLPQKTTIILVTLLIAFVSLVGCVFFICTRSMLQSSQREQLSAFAYGVAATLGQTGTGENTTQIEFSALDKTPNLEFIVLTDASDRQLAALISDHDAWSAFHARFSAAGTKSRLLGQIQKIVHDGGRTSSAITVPVFLINDSGQPAGLFGYLHCSFSADAMAGQLRFLQAFVLLTCIGAMLVAIPVASLVARHITVPIQRLAKAAHALADGDLGHRVSIRRSDELGELARAFNRMADTVQAQQEDIRNINSGLEEKVHDRTAELEKVNKRLQAEISEKEDFLRAVSHDLNAPLRNIAGMASMLALKYQSSLEKDALQRLERIQKNVQVECELINELLELSRIKSRREKIERVDLHELVLAVAEGFSSDLETRGITLRITTPLPPMRAEKMRMRQVFQNLIDNAIKYMRDDGPREIKIAAHVSPGASGEFIFSIADTGMGIAREDIPGLFHVFRRAKNASVMKVPGKGVGLASVKSIIENYTGRLWVESVQGSGTTFCFALPRTHFELTQEVAA